MSATKTSPETLTLTASDLRAAGWSDSTDTDGVLWLWPPHDGGDVPPAAMALVRAWDLEIERDNGEPVCRAAHITIDRSR